MSTDLNEETFLRRSTRIRRTPDRLTYPIEAVVHIENVDQETELSFNTQSIPNSGRNVAGSSRIGSVSSTYTIRRQNLRRSQFLEEKEKILREKEEFNNKILREREELNNEKFLNDQESIELEQEDNASESSYQSDRMRSWVNDQAKHFHQQEVNVEIGNFRKEKILESQNFRQQEYFHNENIQKNQDNRQKESQDSCTVKELVNGLCEAIGRLANKQPQLNDDSNLKVLLARQGVGKDLLHFSGNPEDWLMFINQYKKSSQVCNFTEEENMMRLQKALTGEAKETCQSLFVSPLNVKRILETLELRFGRPEYLIKSLMNKVRDVPPPRFEKPDTVVKFSIAVQNLVVNLQNLGKKEYMWNPELVEELENKLPSIMRFMWSVHKSSLAASSNCTLENLANWLNNNAIAVCGNINFEEKEKQERLKNRGERIERFRKPEFKYSQKERVNTCTEKISISNSGRECDLCKNCDHDIQDCNLFIEEDVMDRYKIAKEKRLCFCCFSSKHPIYNCNKKRVCKINNCRKIHHPLLHTEQIETISHVVSENQETLLRIIPVKLKGPNGEKNTFAMLDSGSTATLIKESIAKEIGLEGKKQSLCLQWANGDLNIEENSEKVEVEISGTKENMKKYNISNVRTISSLPLPKQTINKEEIKKKWKHLSDVDFEEYFDGQPSILLGEDMNLLTVPRKVIHGPWNEPVATKTWLGWVLSGKSENKNSFENKQIEHMDKGSEIEIDKNREKKILTKVKKKMSKRKRLMQPQPF